MLTSEFDYTLPKELIAQSPASSRDSSRLMIVDRRTKKIQHRHFYDIVNYLSQGDLLVWNNTKVFKARLCGRVMLDEAADGISDELEKRLDLTDRILNMPAVEIFLLRPQENFGVWNVLTKPGRKLRLGMKVVFAEDFVCEIMLKEKDGTVLVQFNEDDISVRAKANKYGEVPVPPYINSPLEGGRGVLVNQYQTIYAKHEGSVAAPTAGFHFTPELIEELKNKGVEFAEVTLHVGLGTFLPVKTDKIEDHKMHSEWVELTAANADKINTAKAEGRRVVAIGTTTVRTLEGIACLEGKHVLCHSEPIRQAQGKLRERVKRANGVEESINKQTKGSFANAQDDKKSVTLKPYTGDTNLFITPGFKFQIIDALITNFHLPKSTLIMLVSAFVGDTKFVLDCYQKAVEANYRFYSFGDAMLIK